MEGRVVLCAIGLALLMYCGLSDASVSYVRWGRSVCPTGVHKLYSGYMVGDHVLGRGNGANFLCAPEQPQFVRPVAGSQSVGYLWGAEFEVPGMETLFLHDNVGGAPLQDQDALCVRCYVPDATDVMMIPGRVDCYNTGYDLQYKGFLVAEANWPDRQPHEYVCMDEAPEGRVGGNGSSQQGLLYTVQWSCGSLPCSPYIEGNEATCAVCTY